MNRRMRAVIRKEFIQILRDWRSLVVIAVFPMVLLTIYGYGIDLDVSHLRTAVLDQDNTQESRALLDSFQYSEYFDFRVPMSSYSDINGIMDRSQAKVAVIVPQGFSDDLAGNSAAPVQVIVDGSDATTAGLAISYATRIVQAFNEDLQASAFEARGISTADSPGVDLRTRFWYNPELDSTNFIVPGLVALILMLLSALLTSMTIVRERERGTMEQIIVSPILPHELIIGKLIPYVVIAFLEVLLVITTGRFIFGVRIVGSVPLLLLESLIFVTSALGLGMLISSVANSQMVAMTIALMATMLPTVLLSGFVFPINTMPAPIRAVTYLIPARYFLVIVRSIYLKGIGLSILWEPTVLLLIVGFVLVMASTKRFRKVM